MPVGTAQKQKVTVKSRQTDLTLGSVLEHRATGNKMRRTCRDPGMHCPPSKSTAHYPQRRPAQYRLRSLWQPVLPPSIRTTTKRKGTRIDTQSGWMGITNEIRTNTKVSATGPVYDKSGTGTSASDLFDICTFKILLSTTFNDEPTQLLTAARYLAKAGTNAKRQLKLLLRHRAETAGQRKSQMKYALLATSTRASR